MKRLIIELGVLAFVLFFGVAALVTSSYCFFHYGYKRGSSDMADYVLKELQGTKESHAPAPQSDEDTGNVGHFGS